MRHWNLFGLIGAIAVIDCSTTPSLTVVGSSDGSTSIDGSPAGDGSDRTDSSSDTDGSDHTDGGSGTDGSAGIDGGGGGSPFPSGTICNNTGQIRVPPTTLETVIIFMFENENYSSVNGNSDAPYMNSISSQCGHATNFLDNCFASYLDSEPHYLAATSGSNCNTGLDTSGSGCIVSDDDATSQQLSTTSIFQQVSSWKSYQESMPSACDKSSSGLYACKHNPPPYYSQLTSGTTCSAYDVPIAPLTCNKSTTMTACGTPNNVLTTDLANDTLPAYMFITPNLNNDMHDGTVTEGDNWLYTYLPLVLTSPAYLRGGVVVFVLWDQESGMTAVNEATPNFFISPYITAGMVSSATMNHFSGLRAVENALGITTFLGCASGTISGGGTCPSGSTTDLRAEFNF